MSLNFITSNNPLNLVSDAIHCLQSEQSIALVTLVNIEGNAPYPVGSQMLVRLNGDYVGQITGGCAEQAISDQAVVAIKSGQNSVQRYGLNSPYFDIKLPCGSGIDVHFETQLTLNQFLEIKETLSKRLSVLQDFGGYLKKYIPSPRILIFGQGPILVKLAQLALQTGYDVCCIAQNNATSRLLKNDSLDFQELNYASAVFDQSLDKYTAVVSLFHEHELEINLLQKAVRSDAFYIGALGSKKTHRERIANLKKNGLKDDQLSRINGPVGLDIGANTPSQIALSILAELTAYLNKKESL